MAKTDHLQDFEFKWETVSHYEDPYDDPLWTLFWGAVVSFSILYSIIMKDFLFLVIGLLGLIFFFHPIFYEPNFIRITINKKGIDYNGNFYRWEDIEGFEISNNGLRNYIFFVFSNRIRPGFSIPLEDYVPLDELRNTLKKFLSEYEGAIPFYEKLYRNIFK
ncbi:MAG: hypothetical protein ACP5JU_01835 [Minisyncoccia bacterium]